MKAKLVYLSESYDGFEFRVDETDWEEIPDADAKLLAKHQRELPQWNGLDAKLVVQSMVPLKQTVSEVVALLQQREQQREAQRIEAERKRAIKAREKAAKDVEAKRKLLQQLQEELGGVQ